MPAQSRVLGEDEPRVGQRELRTQPAVVGIAVREEDGQRVDASVEEDRDEHGVGRPGRERLRDAVVERARRRGIDTDAWTWLSSQAGQQLFYPPNVAGWDDNRWLDTASFRGRWYVAETALGKTTVNPWKKPPKGFPKDANGLLDKAVASLGSPTLEDGAKAILLQFAQDSLNDPEYDPSFPMMVYNALRQLLLTAPEAQTC